MLKALLFAIGLSFITSAATAQQPGEVSSALTVARIVTSADGKEAREPAAEAKPGDTLEYVATYRNGGKTRARNLEATLPIPPGTEYLPASARPGELRASLDGATYEAVPLKRTVRRPDGTVAEELVPYSEYRYLRWAPRDLAAGAAARFSARVRVVRDEVRPASRGQE